MTQKIKISKNTLHKKINLLKDYYFIKQDEVPLRLTTAYADIYLWLHLLNANVAQRHPVSIQAQDKLNKLWKDFKKDRCSIHFCIRPYDYLNAVQIIPKQSKLRYKQYCKDHKEHYFQKTKSKKIINRK